MIFVLFRWRLIQICKPLLFSLNLHNDVLYQQIQKNRGNFDKIGVVQKITRNYNALTPHKNIFATEFKKKIGWNWFIVKSEKRTKIRKANYRWNIFKTIRLQKKNIVALLLGKHVLVNTFIKSPYLSLRNDILSHPNLVEKQLYIIRFVEKYTRYFILGDIKKKDKKIVQENNFWFYYIQSKTPLLPIFYYSRLVSK